MMFTHDPWFTISTAAIVEVGKELSLALSVEFNIDWLNLRNNWQPGDFMFNILLSSIAAFTGAWIIRIIGCPRLIIYPHEDIDRISYEYGIKMSKAKAIEYAYSKIMMIRWKYFAELLIVSWIVAYVYYLEKDEFKSPSVYETQCMRIDWLLYLLIQSFVLIVMYIINKNSPFERRVIWKKDTKKYNLFYGLLAIVLYSIHIPSSCMFREPKIMLLYSILVLLGILLTLYVLSNTFLKDYMYTRRFTMVNGTHMYSNERVYESVPRMLVNKEYK
jgi:hypothetical protein